MKNELVIYILLPILVVLIFSLSFLLYKFINKRLWKSRLSLMEQKLKKIRINDVEAKLKRVESLSIKNQKNKDIFSILKDKYSIIINDVENLKDYIRKVSIYMEEKKVNYRKIKENYVQFNDIHNRITMYINRFQIEAKQIVSQDEYLRNKHLGIIEILRVAEERYNEKLFSYDKIKVKIESMLKEIHLLSEEFNIGEQSFNVAKSEEILENLFTKVKYFVQVVDEAQKIETFLYSQLKNKIKAIVTNFNEKNNEVGGTLVDNVSGYIRKVIKSKYDKTRELYMNLEFDKAKEHINDIISALVKINRNINFEVDSRNLFWNTFEDVNEYTKKVMRTWITLFEKSKGVKQNSKYYNEMKLSIINTREALKSLDKQAIRYNDLKDKKEMPFSSKIIWLKELCKMLEIFIKKMNALSDLIDSSQYEVIVLRNKFASIQSAINEIIVSIKTGEITLDDENNKTFNWILNERNQIVSLLDSETNLEKLELRINKMIKSFSMFYKSINGNVQIARHIRNMISHLSSQRALNPSLNAMLSSAEKMYLDGEYANSLNAIISAITKGSE